MSKKYLPIELPTQIQLLQKEIDSLRLEVNEIVQKTSAFENILRSKIEDELIEEQELSQLYKLQKKAKKEKRQIQRKLGKNYQESTGIQTTKRTVFPEKNSKEQLQKKHLYREAMLHVHPDKFSMQKDKLDLATEITAKLIEIYQSGDLASLKAYHAHIFNGNTSLQPLGKPIQTKGSGRAYLLQERKKVLEELSLAKNRHTYKILTEYENPLTFVDELKSYYKNRISKLRKRTRTK
ncbi:hypothetical protein H4O18_03275 [Arenibacter sp. BSSL-BM3]|uniref:J domain-containing protein n=1 Tax=Arenibacter arenosicollis TaxID=2762274 RepID=A0ABR7QIK6_9FLAO|nr:hypothetical protein [Arenibacter arenosicollis]MBC8767005.1 hypothetical protein [Arenibacter arenosicollis]